MNLPAQNRVVERSNSLGAKIVAKLSGGEALAKSLVREGVEVIFGLPGVQMYGLITGIRDEPGLRMITARHEYSTTHMADGYARATGKPSVAMVVPGVGLTMRDLGLRPRTRVRRRCCYSLAKCPVDRSAKGSTDCMKSSINPI